MLRLSLTLEQRAYLTQVRALSADWNGQEVLVDLTRAESEKFLSYEVTPLHALQPVPRQDAECFLVLHERHENCRLHVIAAEDELRAGYVVVH